MISCRFKRTGNERSLHWICAITPSEGSTTGVGGWSPVHPWEEVHTATNAYVRPLASSSLTITTSVESSMSVVLDDL